MNSPFFTCVLLCPPFVFVLRHSVLPYEGMGAFFADRGKGVKLEDLIHAQKHGVFLFKPGHLPPTFLKTVSLV